MSTADLWLDWTLSTSVDELRRLLPGILEPAGYRVVERRTTASASGWAAFDVASVGVARAQDVGTGRSQMFLTGSDDEELNRAAVLLYVELIRRGALAPPEPLRTPSRPLAV